jgi:hypothetical protein
MPTHSSSSFSSVAPSTPPVRIRLTKSSVERLPAVSSGQRLYWDADLPGFGLRICKTSKTYIAEGRLRGRTCRVKLGSTKLLTSETARQEARKVLLAMSLGRDPRWRRANAETPTLDHAFTAYIGSRSLKQTTLQDYERIRGKDFARWLKLPITEITKDMVELRHRELGKRSHARANNAMRLLRAVLNYASVKYELEDGTPLLVSNPVQRLTKTKAWFRIDRRKTLIRAHELGPWLRAVIALSGESRRQSERSGITCSAWS